MVLYHHSLDNDKTSENVRKHPSFNFFEELQVLRSWVVWKRWLNHHFLQFLFNRKLPLVLCAESLHCFICCQKVKHLKSFARNTADVTLLCLHAYLCIWVHLCFYILCASLWFRVNICWWCKGCYGSNLFLVNTGE